MNVTVVDLTVTPATLGEPEAEQTAEDETWWWRDPETPRDPEDKRIPWWEPIRPDEAALTECVRSLSWDWGRRWGVATDDADDRGVNFFALPGLRNELAVELTGTASCPNGVLVQRVGPVGEFERLEVPHTVRALGTTRRPMVLRLPDAARLTVDEAVTVAAGHLRGAGLPSGHRCEPVPWVVR